MPRPSIIQVMEDTALLGGWFSADSWLPWKVFLKASFAIPFDAQELALFRQFSKRKIPPDAPAREGWVIVGRRGNSRRVELLDNQRLFGQLISLER